MMGRGKGEGEGTGFHRECAPADLFGFSIPFELILLKSLFSPWAGKAKDLRDLTQNRARGSPEMKME